jgi:hypothetical protein
VYENLCQRQQGTQVRNQRSAMLHVRAFPSSSLRQFMRMLVHRCRVPQVWTGPMGARRISSTSTSTINSNCGFANVRHRARLRVMLTGVLALARSSTSSVAVIAPQMTGTRVTVNLRSESECQMSGLQ